MDLTWEDFAKVDIRVGTIIDAQDFLEAINPAYKLKIDFGDLGIKKSSAQITQLYSKQDLIGMQVTAVVNFPPKQIATFMSECLVLGAIGENKEVSLLNPSVKTFNGSKVG